MEIERSRQKVAEARVDAQFQEVSVDYIPSPEDHFDVVICSFRNFHISKEVKRKGIEDIYWILKTGGRLTVINLAPAPGGLSRSVVNFFLGFIPKHDLRKLFVLGINSLHHSKLIQCPVSMYRIISFILHDGIKK